MPADAAKHKQANILASHKRFSDWNDLAVQFSPRLIASLLNHIDLGLEARLYEVWYYPLVGIIDKCSIERLAIALLTKWPSSPILNYFPAITKIIASFNFK